MAVASRSSSGQCQWVGGQNSLVQACPSIYRGRRGESGGGGSDGGGGEWGK